MLNKTQEQIMSNWKTMDLEHPLVSVRCITYNHEPYIAQALDGFMMQVTDFPFEIIVHDDASTDKTAEIIREYEKKYPLIVKAIYETENQYSKHDGSLGRIVNTACKGKYIALCEGDDYWIDPLKLQKQVDIMEAHLDVGLVFSDFNVFHQHNGNLEFSVFRNFPNRYKIYYNINDFLEAQAFMSPCTWMLRKTKYITPKSGYIDTTFAMYMDMLATSKVYYLKDATTVYRRLKESASHSKNKRKVYQIIKGRLVIQLDYIAKYNLSEDLKRKVIDSYYRKNISLITLFASDSEFQEAFLYYIQYPIQKTMKIALILKARKNFLLKNLLAFYCDHFR